MPVCRKPVPKANKEQNAKAREPGENKLLPTAIPSARTQEPGEGGNGRHPVPGDSGLPAGPATSPGRAGLRSAGACRPSRSAARALEGGAKRSGTPGWVRTPEQRTGTGPRTGTHSAKRAAGTARLAKGPRAGPHCTR